VIDTVTSIKIRAVIIVLFI